MLLVGLAALAVLAHARALGVPFYYDDLHAIQQNASLLPGASIGQVLTFEPYRPLANATYELDALAWGRETPVGFHVTALGLHALAVVLAQVCLARLARPSVATLAATLMAVHPALVQAVGYCSARADLLCAVLSLAALLAHLRLAETGRARYGVAVVLLWLLALASKETAAALPLVLALSDGLRGDPGGRGRRLWLHAPMLALVALAGAWRVFVYLTREGGGGLDVWQHLAALPLVVWRYLALLVLPVGQTIAHVGPSPSGLLRPEVLAGAAALVVLAIAAWRHRLRAPLVAFGLAWFVVALAPAIVVPLQQRVAEQRLYLASVGGLLAAASVLRPTLGGLLGVRWRLPAGALVLTLLGLTHARYSVWRDPEALWTEALTRGPTCSLAWNNRGGALYDQGRRAEARADFEQALAVDPGCVDALANRASMRLDEGDAAGAAADVEAALRIEPRHVAALLVRSQLRDGAGDLAGALADCDAALDVDPTLVRAIVARGVTLAHLRRPREALDDLDRGLALDPDLVYGLVNRALLRARLGADLDGALADGRRAIALGPSFGMAWCALGLAQARRGELPAARESFARAAALRSDDWTALQLLGEALVLGGEVKEGIETQRRVAALQAHVAPLLEQAEGCKRRGDVNGAIYAYNQALAAAPRLFDALFGRAGARAVLRDLRGSLADLDAALRVDPDDPQALMARGKIRTRLGLPGSAQDYQRALATAPKRAPELLPELRRLTSGR